MDEYYYIEFGDYDVSPRFECEAEAVDWAQAHCTQVEFTLVHECPPQRYD